MAESNTVVKYREFKNRSRLVRHDLALRVAEKSGCAKDIIEPVIIFRV